MLAFHHHQALESLVDLHLYEAVRAHRFTPMSARNARCALQRFVVVAGAAQADELTRRDVERFLEDQHELSPATRRSRLSMVRMFTRWLVDRGHVASDPCAGVRSPRQPRRVSRALTLVSVAELLEVCPDARARAIVYCMVGLGVRCCEVAGLQVGDWDPIRATLFVTGKGGRRRMLPVDVDAADAMRGYLREWPASAGPVFRSYRHHSTGLTAGSVSKLVSEWMYAAGIKRAARDGVSAHALRHTAASDVLDQCGDLRVVQAMLGHAHLATTAIYLRNAQPEQLRAAMAGRHYAREVV